MCDADGKPPFVPPIDPNDQDGQVPLPKEKDGIK